jgi:mannose-6-phosphate isomerase-like protein (cupin superfamily)
VTNDSVFLTVGSEEVPMKEGEVWEINNTRAHAVRNDGDAARVHLVDDWAPAMTARQRVIVRTGADAILSK